MSSREVQVSAVDRRLSVTVNNKHRNTLRRASGNGAFVLRVIAPLVKVKADSESPASIKP